MLNEALASFALLSNIADQTITSIGIKRFGIAYEGNSLGRFLYRKGGLLAMGLGKFGVVVPLVALNCFCYRYSSYYIGSLLNNFALGFFPLLGSLSWVRILTKSSKLEQ